MTMDPAFVAELLALSAALLLAGIAWLAHRLRLLRSRAARLLRAQQEEAAARQRAAARAAWLDAALESLDDGVLVADRDQRVIHWNRRFAVLAGLPENLPREGATLASLLRLSAEAGEFGLVDVDEEIEGQLALIARGPAAFPQLRHRPDGAIVSFDLHALPGGGHVLHCTDVTARHRVGPPAAQAERPAAPPQDGAGAAQGVPPSAAPASVRAAVPLSLRPRRCLVLLVEDMKVNQVVTATQLRREGHRVDIAPSGPEAMRLAARTPYDLILMDLMMPGMSGYDTARHLRALPGLAGRVPIYALTANTGDEERARCVAAGMQGMLTKPLPVSALREVLRQGGTPAPAAPPPGLLDPSRLDELRRDLPAGTLAVLCRQCLEDMDARLPALDAALEAGDPEAIEREAHALAGMAGSYALARVERDARAILAAARRAEVGPARAAAAGLRDALVRSRAAMLAWLPN